LRKGRRLWWLAVAGVVILGCYLIFSRIASNRAREIVSQSLPFGKGFSVESLRVHAFNLKARKVELSSPSLNLCLRLRDFSVRPALLPVRPGGNLAFAFSGPGEISMNSAKQPLKVSGVITGNVKTGEVSISQTTVRLEDLGTAEVTGNLTDWGKKSISLKVNLKGLAVARLASFFKTEVPVEGLVDGVLLVTMGPTEQLQKMDFDLVLSEIHARNDPAMFRGEVKGAYDLKAFRGQLQGLVEKPGGGRLNFSGTLEGDNFSLRFNSEGLQLEEVLHLLPEELKKKLNLSTSGGSIQMKDFVVAGTKKTFPERTTEGRSPSHFLSKRTDRESALFF